MSNHPFNKNNFLCFQKFIHKYSHKSNQFTDICCYHIIKWGFYSRGEKTLHSTSYFRTCALTVCTGHLVQVRVWRKSHIIVRMASSTIWKRYQIYEIVRASRDCGVGSSSGKQEITVEYISWQFVGWMDGCRRGVAIQRHSS